MVLAIINKVKLDPSGGIQVHASVRDSDTDISFLASGLVPAGFGSFPEIAVGIKNKIIQYIVDKGGPTYTVADIKLIGPTVL